MKIFYTFFIIILYFFSGCYEAPHDKKQNSYNNKDALHELYQTSGIEFNRNMKLINFYQSRSGYKEWLVFSSANINIPKMKAPPLPEYLTLNLQDCVNLLESRMAGEKIINPKKTLSSEWETDKFNFRCTLVRATKGDYLIVLRFKKNEERNENK